MAYIFIILISNCIYLQYNHFLNKYDDYSHFLNNSSQLYLICCPEKRPLCLIFTFIHCTLLVHLFGHHIISCTVFSIVHTHTHTASTQFKCWFSVLWIKCNRALTNSNTFLKNFFVFHCNKCIVICRSTCVYIATQESMISELEICSLIYTTAVKQDISLIRGWIKSNEQSWGVMNSDACSTNANETQFCSFQLQDIMKTQSSDLVRASVVIIMLKLKLIHSTNRTLVNVR